MRHQAFNRAGETVSPLPESGPASWIRSGEGGRLGAATGWTAFLFTILSHALVWWLMPEEWPRRVADSAPARTFAELQILTPETETRDEPDRFVITNPEVPANPPDETSHFAARDQQAAQPEPAERDAGTPEVEGEFDEPTQAIVTGEEPTPAEMAELIGELLNPEILPPADSARPIPGFEETEETEGLAVPVAPEPDPDREDGVIEVPVETDAAEQPMELAELPTETPNETVNPRPRPRVSRLSNDPVGTRAGGTNRVGTLAVDARFSEYGDYLTRMLEAVGRQWHLLAWNSLSSSEVGTMVVVRFEIDSSGHIQNTEVEHSTAGLTATLICKDAINARQPFGAWPDDMRSVLGDKQTVRIRFYYR